MEVAMPVTGNTVDCYEDMFKEITRKLYGEDGLSDITTNDRIAPPQDRCLTPVDYEPEGPLLKSDDHLTAFGLAALMQNGFPSNGIFNPTFQQHKANQNFEEKWIISDDDLQWTRSKIASYSPAQKLFRCVECDCVGYLPRVAEHWLGTHSNLRTFRCPQCPYESAWARCVRLHLTRQHNISSEETTDVLLKNNPVLHEISRYLQRLKSRLDVNSGKSSSEDFHSASSTLPSTSGSMTASRTPSTSNAQNNISNESNNISTTNKRYSCSFCPYATDRRDLFTRHENIHREEKPFQCYVCQKQFNRADHVKKHFLRMHREHPYDLNRIRRHPPKNASGMSFYNRYNSNDISSAHSPDSVTNDVNIGSSLTIPNGLCNISKAVNSKQFSGRLDSKCAPTLKSCNVGKSSSKKKGDKRFSCCYCSWTGVDNWCLKRHMNTHLKPFVCGLCDYKAARSERLATHVLKVHNKRACGKCSFLADDPAQLTIHQQDQHPLDQRNNRSNHSSRSFSYNVNNIGNNLSCNSNPNGNASNSCIAFLSNNQNINKTTYDAANATAIMQQSVRLLQSDSNKSWKQYTPKQHGAARLFNYMEASDSSEPESDSKGPEETSRINITHRISSDFLEAGDVASHLKSTKEMEKEEVELPLFVCKSCGCEFEDDASLETHKFIKCHASTSPAKQPDEIKENVNPKLKYQCQICSETFNSQFSIMFHMSTHSMLYLQHSPNDFVQEKEIHKRSRKQMKPKKVVSPIMDHKEDAINSCNFKRRLSEKYMLQFFQKRRLSCMLCRTAKLSQFRSKSKLILHKYWRHDKNKFQCEHCNLLFRHRYQVVLHSSSVHTSKTLSNPKIQQAPTAPVKEMVNNEVCAVAASQEISQPYVNHSYITSVPDISNTSASVHKLGVSFLDHSFLHTNSTLNSHMPIIIPTFPPC